MIISETEQFVFVHNPKCAGTSVRGALLKYDTTGNFFWMFDEWNGYTIDKAHMPLYIMKQKYPQYFSILAETFSFIFIRNPYERYISAFNESHGEIYQNFIKTGDSRHYKETLRDFTEGMHFDLIDLLNRKEHRFISQKDLVYLKDKSVIDLILKVEEWPQALRKLGLLRPKLAASIATSVLLNQKPMPLPFEELWTRSMREKINRVYESDFVLFGYETKW